MNHTKIPNLSIDSLDGSSGVSTPSLTVASTASFVCSGVASLAGAVGVSGALQSTGTLTVGSSGVGIKAIRQSTTSIRIVGTAGDSTTTSATVSGMTVGDVVLAIRPASIWSGSYYDIALEGVPAADACTIVARNSTTTSITADAMNATITWLDLT